MKSTVKILGKLALLVMFLYVTPFFSGFQQTFGKAGDLLDNFVVRQKTLKNTVSIKNQLNVLSYNSNLTIPKDEIAVETTQEDPVIIPQITQKKTTSNEEKKDDSKKYSTGKKIYIYNTHQSEGYVGGKTVMDAAAILGKKLEDKGFKVVLETNDFEKYLASKGLDYNKSYVASYNYLNDALVNYGGFDLCLDLHRDSIPREVSYLKANGKTYAKAMMVVGGLGKNAKSATSTSTTLTDIINKKQNGIMRSVMVREAYYNQEVHKNVLLMELGGDVNSFEEVTNSLDIIADGIYDLLMKG